MGKLPQKVSETLERLKENSDHYLSVKIINGHCYVYEATSKWDKENKKVRSITRYLGRITGGGIFIPGIRRDAELGAAHADVFDKSSAVDGGAPDVPQSPGKEYSSDYENAILEGLSANGRISLPELGKIVGLKPTTLESHKKGVERKYGIRYRAEIDLKKLGYLEYLILIKFEDDVPDLKELRIALEKEPSIQLSLLTQGDYDLVMYAIFGARDDMREEISSLRGRLFESRNFKLYLVPFYTSQGFVPLREEFFGLLKDKVKKEAHTPSNGRLLNREYLVLKELNLNGDVEFSKMDSSNDFGTGSSRYTYNRLVEKGIIKRITISIGNIQTKYLALILLDEINHSKFIRDRDYLMRTMAQDSGNPVGKYALVGEIKATDGMLFLLPVFSGYDLDKTREELRKVNGTKINRLIITNVITGSLCYRRLGSGKNTKDAFKN